MIFIYLDKFLSSKLSYISGVILIIASAIVIMCSRFRELSDPIVPFVQKALDPSLYQNDFYVRNSIINSSSYIYDIIEFFSVNIIDNYFVIVVYLLSVVVSGIAVWLIFSGPLDLRYWYLRVVVLFAAMFSNDKLIFQNDNSWAPDRFMSFSLVASALRIWFLYFLLTGRLVWMCLTLVPINFLAFKVGWLPTLVAAIILLRHSRSPAAWGPLVASLIAPVILAFSALAAVGPDDARQMIELFLSIYGTEDNPFGGHIVSFLLYPAGAVFLWWRAPIDFDGQATFRVRALLLVSGLVYVFGGLYLSGLYRYLPVPGLVLLSPARALELSGLLIYFVLLAWIVRTDLLWMPERVLLFLAALILRVPSELKWIVIPAGLVVLCLILRAAGLLLRRKYDRLPDFGGAAGFTLALGLFAPIPAVIFGLNVSGKRATLLMDPVIGIYSSSIPAGVVADLCILAEDRSDRIIVFTEEYRGKLQASSLNHYAKKSDLGGNPYYLSTMTDINVLKDRSDLKTRIISSLNAGELSPDDMNRMKELNVSVVVPIDYENKINFMKKIKKYGFMVEMAPVYNETK